MRILVLLSVCSLFVLSATAQPPAPMNAKPAIDLSLMDPTVGPGEDFFHYVNGKWLGKTEIPGDRERWGSFDELVKNTDAQTLQVLREAAANGNLPAGTDQAKAASFFESGLDVGHRNAGGLDPVRPMLDRIEHLASTDELPELLVQLKRQGIGAFLDIDVSPDLKNSTLYTVYVGTADLGLPEREYYLKTDSASVALREQYKDHLRNMMAFTGMDPARARLASERILDLETRMAEAMMPKEQRRNPYNTYHPMAVADLAGQVPSFDWTAYLGLFGLGRLNTLVVNDPAYLVRLEELWSSRDLPAWRDYLTWSLLHQAAPYLTEDLGREQFDFYGRTMRGLQAMRPLEERVLGVVNARIGEAVGQLYVDRWFPPKAKERAVAMVQDILDAFGDRIRQLEWMSDTTKEMALKKLSTFTVKIGYPDDWKDYASLSIRDYPSGGSYWSNVTAAIGWNLDRDLSKVGKEVDRKEWFMSPQTVNAYYNPLFNEIVFPAAILQPPFFYFEADAAVNFGAIGAVIGHEISHGFDDQGSRFDEKGNLANWWTEGDRERFNARTARLVEQYNAYEPLPGVHVNGAFTLGENIGDLGGVNVSYTGLQRHYAREGRPGTLDGFSGEQRFFLSWATIWRIKIRDEALKTQVATDPHSPGICRAVGPLVNMTAFQDAFGIRPGQALYVAPEAQVRIW